MITIKLPVSILLVFVAFSLSSQNEGLKWVIGYSNSDNPDYSIMHLDFSGPSLVIDWHFDERMQIRETSSNICDNNGEVILTTNGMQIFGKNGFHILDTISFVDDPLGYWNWYYDDFLGPLGFFKHEGAIILPVPDSDNDYSVLYHFAELHSSLGFPTKKYLEARLHWQEDSTFQVVYKDSLIGTTHEYYSGTLVATKHANGRDWWIVTFERDGNAYYSFLLEPSGISLFQQGETTVTMEGGLGQTAMSPSGNYIARVEGTTLNDGQNIYLFQFDRCSGEIEPIETIHTTTGYFTGAAFSPNEKYLYADDNNNLWQWDMQASDIASTQMLVDTFDGFVQPGWFGTIFGPLSNAPDGRIYISPASGSSEFMHVINQPDLASNDVQFIQHAFDFKVPFGRSSPNIPNYRLGPLDGSDCDTLGINNLPVAHFRFAENILGEKHTILFTDISYFDPETWHWDFGDGMTSSEIHPVHTFEDGLYHVCLTVSNANASDSTCQWVEILPTAIEEEMDSALPDLSISPNPFNEVLEIKSRSGIFRSTHLQLIDMHGQCLIEQTHAPVPVNLHVPHLPSGMYLCRIAEEDGTIYSFKVMKQ